jgi:formylglycine-generating enzyme required for sulfatase activity
LRVPPGCRAAAGTPAEPYTKSGWAQAIVHEATGMEMVYVPAGSFFMGSPESETWATPFEWPQHRVTLTKGFYLGKTEVTQAQWEKMMGKNPAHFKNVGLEAPVEMVSWNDCQEFCQKAGGGLRLPTEAEWEYACRAGTTTRFYYGDDPSYTGLASHAWYSANSGGQTHPVGQKPANPWGLYDMCGNVWQWCQDWYDVYPGGSLTDPQGPATSPYDERVLRGGSYYDPGAYARAASRWEDLPDSQSYYPYYGFRVVLAPSGQ